MFISILFFAWLDVQPLVFHDDTFSDFTVSPFIEEIGTGCLENPSLAGQLIELSVSEPQYSYEEPQSTDWSITPERGIDPGKMTTVLNVVPARTPIPKPPVPESDELTPMVVPEPAAIITLTGLMLLVLLFGPFRKRPRKI